METGAKRKTNCKIQNIYTRNIKWDKTASAHNKDTQIEKTNLHDTLYQSQHVYKQMQDKNMDELQFEKIRVPIGTSVPLNEARKME